MTNSRSHFDVWSACSWISGEAAFCLMFFAQEWSPNEFFTSKSPDKGSSPPIRSDGYEELLILDWTLQALWAVLRAGMMTATLRVQMRAVTTRLHQTAAHQRLIGSSTTLFSFPKSLDLSGDLSVMYTSIAEAKFCT